MACLWHAGFPHSEIPGSKLTSSSPGLIAGCRVLLRRLAPRHPPRALSTSVPLRDLRLLGSRLLLLLADENRQQQGTRPLPASISERTMAFSFQGACRASRRRRGVAPSEPGGMALPCRTAAAVPYVSLPRRARATGPRTTFFLLRRKEVIHPLVLEGIPCFDLTPITGPALDAALPCGLGLRFRAYPALMV